MAQKPTPKKPSQTSAAAARQEKTSHPTTTGKPNSGADLSKIDAEIVRLLNRRAAETLKLAETAPDRKAALYDPKSDDELAARLDADNHGPLTGTVLRSVFREVMSAVRNQVRLQRVAYLGPAYSFTHMAAQERFGTSAELIPVNTIAAVFEEVNRGHADFGLVPIENSTDGRIIDTLDMFTRLPLRVCGEVQLCIHHNLLGRTPRSEVHEIYSKPQALSQCRDWLARNMPHAKLIDVTSTSTAAQIARDKPGAAAVASRQAAMQYNLETLAHNIEDNKQNITRFAVIGDKLMNPTGKDRTSLLLQIPHKPGALADALEIYKRGKINLTWIESFPLRAPESGYIFFIDAEGHQKEPKMKRALEELSGIAVRIEILGSYPRSEPLE